MAPIPQHSQVNKIHFSPKNMTTLCYFDVYNKFFAYNSACKEVTLFAQCSDITNCRAEPKAFVTDINHAEENI